MMTSAIYGLPITPAALADEKGNSVVVQSVHSAEWLERLLRPLCTEMGCSAGFASRPLTGEQLRQVGAVVLMHDFAVCVAFGERCALTSINNPLVLAHCDALCFHCNVLLLRSMSL